MARTPKSRYPNTNWGWYRYYSARFNKTEHPDTAYLAMLYLYAHLALGDTVVVA